MKRGQPNTVLITQNQLKDYSGSEIVTLELAEHFTQKMGCKVVVLTVYADSPILDDFNALRDVQVLIYGSEEANQLKAKNFDLIWIHHQLLTRDMLEQLTKLPADKRPKVIFHHMSGQTPLEFPVFYLLERSIADVVLFNSPETKDSIHETGIKFPYSTEEVFGNPAPDKFITNSKRRLPNSPSRVAVVSNHPPPELVEAGEKLKSSGVSLDYFGRIIGKEQRVTPDTLSQYDAVISIGKTVQYSLALCLPVYCYDHFGGPGYLSIDNYDLAMRRNFSGRGFEQKSAEEIAKEIVGDYTKAVKSTVNLHGQYAADYALSKRLGKVLRALYERSSRAIKISSADIEAYEKSIIVRSEYFANYKILLKRHQIKVDSDTVAYQSLVARYEAAMKANEEKKLQIQALLSSNRYKLGGIVTEPLMLIKRRLWHR